MAGSASKIRAGGAFYELLVNNNPLVKGLKTAENLVRTSVAGTAKGIAKGMGSIGSSIARTLTSPITALAAALAPLAAGKLFAGMSTELVDISRRTGASVQALQTLGYVATRTGADLGAVEGVLTTLRDKLTDAARGGEEAQLTFQKLGLNFLELSRMKPEDRLRKVAQALNSIPNPAVRAAMATELLGSTDLLPMLQDMDKMEARAKRLGLVLGGETVNAGKQLGNALEDLHSNLMATASVIGAKIAPAVTQMIEKWVEMSGHTRAWIADNSAMFSSAEALWAFLKLQWSKGSAFILEQFGLANVGMKGFWIDTQAAFESGWERFKHGASHSFGFVSDVAKTVFKTIAELGIATADALASAFAYVSDDMADALQNVGIAMRKIMHKLNLKEVAQGGKDLVSKMLDQDNPELRNKLAAIEQKRLNSKMLLPGAGRENADAEIARLEAEYEEAKRKAAANAPKPGANLPGPNAGGGNKPGAGNDQHGFGAAAMHVQGIGAVDVRSKEGFASVAASLREAQIGQQQYALQQRQYIVERDIRGFIQKLTVVGKK